jgi:hypothetical protein
MKSGQPSVFDPACSSPRTSWYSPRRMASALGAASITSGLW